MLTSCMHFLLNTLYRFINFLDSVAIGEIDSRLGEIFNNMQKFITIVDDIFSNSVPLTFLSGMGTQVIYRPSLCLLNMDTFCWI